MTRKFTKYLVLILIVFTVSWLVITSHTVGIANSFLKAHPSHVNVTNEQIAQSSRRGRVSPIPNAAFVNSLYGDGIGIGVGVSSAQNASINDVIGYNSRLLIPGSTGREIGATLGFISQAQERIWGHLAAAGFSDQDSEYYYPCSYAGTFAIGWRSTDSEGCPTVSFSSSRNPVQIGPKLQKHVSTGDKRIDRWVAPINLRHYCSAVADSGEAWSVTLSEKRWTEDEVKAVCDQALVECETQADGTCSVANRGDWRTVVPNDERNRPLRQVDLILRCSEGRIYYRQSSAREVHQGWQQLEAEARSENATACTFYIQYFDEVLISPTGDDHNLINTVSSDDGFVINDLVGSVIIQPPGDPNITLPIRLEVGEKYVFLYPTNVGEKDDIPNSERKEIIDSPVIQAFLESGNWDDLLKPEVDLYLEKVYGGFYLPPPVEVSDPIRFDDGIEVRTATIDLTKNIILTVDPANGINERNFESFIGQRNASLILGGIYEGNWNLISTGISNTQNNRSQYTLLGIDAENRPEVVTLTDATAQPRWDEYWFAVQAGPRLVRDGQATVTESSARAEGHANLDVTTPTRRAAIGFSRDGNQLIYVMTERGSSVSIRRLAEIMASDEVGAWQAMNLDGGDGPAISTAEEIFARPGAGRDQSHFMVVYEAAQAPEMTRAAWDRFSQANGASIFEE